MTKNVLVVLYTVFAAAIAFLIGLIFMSRAITNGIVKVDPKTDTNQLVITLDSITNKKLVPFGQANDPDETDKIELKYRVDIKGSFTNYLLTTSLDSVDVEGDSSLGHLFIFQITKEQQIRKYGYVTIIIRMERPSDQEEYQKLADKKVTITFNFKAEKVSI